MEKMMQPNIVLIRWTGDWATELNALPSGSRSFHRCLLVSYHKTIGYFRASLWPTPQRYRYYNGRYFGYESLPLLSHPMQQAEHKEDILRPKRTSIIQNYYRMFVHAQSPLNCSASWHFPLAVSHSSEHNKNNKCIKETSLKSCWWNMRPVAPLHKSLLSCD